VKLLDEEITGKDLEELLLIKQQMSDTTSNMSLRKNSNQTPYG
jgi:hypothetical protein